MSIAPAASATRRAIGIVRVSQVKGREGESFASPGQQRDRIRAACERDAKERSGEAQARAVARGVMPWPNVPPGYRRGDDGSLEPDPATKIRYFIRLRMAAGHDN